jgi:hypothetical protein
MLLIAPAALRSAVGRGLAWGRGGGGGGGRRRIYRRRREEEGQFTTSLVLSAPST